MKKNLFAVFAIFHIGIILVVSLYSSYTTVCDFYHKPKNPWLHSVMFSFFDFKPIQVYCRYTGTETGYGFFAPNVRSGGSVTVQLNGKNMFPQFNSLEGQIRFSGLSGELIENLLTPVDTMEMHAREISIVKNKYHEILFKNIAVKMANESHQSVDSVMICYNLVRFPTLTDAREGRFDKPRLYKLKELKYNLKQ